jgi:phosphate transport system protein
MFRELLTLFKSDDAIARMGDTFSGMLKLATQLTRAAGVYYFDTRPTPDDRTAIYKQDIQLNKLQRRVRKQIITHLTLNTGQGHAAYGLLLMSLVKDVERIGDYCKNLVEIYDEGGGALPDDDNTAELREIRAIIEESLQAADRVFARSDTPTALDLMRQGRDVNRRCDALVTRIAQSDYDAATTTTLVLGARYYKRIQSHLLNVLSGVVMPLHKVDYYDEDALPGERASV